MLVVVDVLQIPQQGVGHVHAGAAERDHRQDVAAHTVAHHAEPLGRDTDPAQDTGVGGEVLFEHDLDLIEVVFEAAGLDLVGLLDEVALGDQHQAVLAAHLLQHLGHSGKEAHRRGELVVDQVDDLADHGRGHTPLGDRDCRLDCRQTEGLHAVAEHRQVLLLHTRKCGLHVDAVGGIGRHQLHEPLLVGVEAVLAVPQGVVGIEADNIERCPTHRCRALR